MRVYDLRQADGLQEIATQWRKRVQPSCSSLRLASLADEHFVSGQGRASQIALDIQKDIEVRP